MLHTPVRVEAVSGSEKLATFLTWKPFSVYVRLHVFLNILPDPAGAATYPTLILSALVLLGQFFDLGIQSGDPNKFVSFCA